MFLLWGLNERCLLWFMTASKGDLNTKFPKLVVLTNVKKTQTRSCFNDTGCYRGVTSFSLPFVNFSKTNGPESVSWWLLRFIGSWYMNKRLSRSGKKRGGGATAEALLDLQTFVTDGVSSLTLSCLTKTSPRLKRHPSVLVGNNDRLPLGGSQSIWILSLLPLLYLW